MTGKWISLRELQLQVIPRVYYCEKWHLGAYTAITALTAAAVTAAATEWGCGTATSLVLAASQEVGRKVR
eukprot:gene12173-biopygen2401